jgi:hypothetical protein
MAVKKRGNIRRTVAFSKIEFTLIRDGLSQIRKQAIQAGDDFKAAFAESTIDHVDAVLDKMRTTIGDAE